MRIIRIDTCTACPHLITSLLFAKVENWYCCDAKKYFLKTEKIPDFCLLEKESQ